MTLNSTTEHWELDGIDYYCRRTEINDREDGPQIVHQMVDANGRSIYYQRDAAYSNYLFKVKPDDERYIYHDSNGDSGYCDPCEDNIDYRMIWDESKGGWGTGE